MFPPHAVLPPRFARGLPVLSVAAALASPARAQFLEPAILLQVQTGEASGDNFGWVSVPVADLDGDGAAEFVTSSPFRSPGRAAAGVVYAYSGRTGALLWQQAGLVAGGTLVWALAAAADMDRDGKADVLAGAPGGNGIAGEVFVYSGARGNLFARSRLGASNDGYGSVDFMLTAATFQSARGRCYLVSGCRGGRLVLGRGVAGSGGFEASLDLAGCPAPGGTVTVQVARGRGGAIGASAIGMRRQQVPIGAGFASVVPDLWLPHTLNGGSGIAGAGTFAWAFALADDPALRALDLHLQAAYVDPGAFAGLSLTAGLTMASR